MGWVKKRILTVLLAVSMVLSLTVSTPVVVSAAQDYLSITLADIIIAWYNASGVAIGDTDIANAIYSAYSGITLADLADHDCLTAMDGVYADGTPEMRVYVKELIGYGNLTVPMIYVRVSKLRQYIGELPASNVAKEALIAMFDWEGNFWGEAFFGVLGGAIGSVVNTGKLSYNFAVNTLTDISESFKSSFIGKTLLDAYRHFTGTTYFHDLLDEGIPVTPTPGAGGSELTMNYDAGGYAGIAGMGNAEVSLCLRLPEHLYCYIDYSGKTINFYIYNNTDTKKAFQYNNGVYDSSTNTLSPKYSSWSNLSCNAHTLRSLVSWTCDKTVTSVFYGGYCLKDDSVAWNNNTAITNYCKANDPWGAPPPTTNLPGITKYINNAVGNILSDNYLNLSPNISKDEFMYIFDRPTYIETLNQITNNTDNGDYSQNSTIINNYNTEYVEPPIIVPDRPTSAPAPTGQPVQPTVSPRPTQIPEEVSNIIYEGGISEEITKKFPFCIPWDIKAMIDRLWAPDRRAPYIHWDATFGSWGKLGEVDIDLSDFDNAAAIFRSTTLLLWIVGLVVITKHLIG